MKTPDPSNLSIVEMIMRIRDLEAQNQWLRQKMRQQQTWHARAARVRAEADIPEQRKPDNSDMSDTLSDMVP